MSKWIILTNGNYYRIAEDDETKGFYENQGYTSQAISDEDFTHIKNSTKEFVSKNPLDATLQNHCATEDKSFDQKETVNFIAELLHEVKYANTHNANPPAIWASSIPTLESSLAKAEGDTVTYPIAGRSIAQACESNGMPVPHYCEFLSP